MAKAHIRPIKGEKLADFVSRFMSNPHNIDTYPDDKQRLAIAHSLYEAAKKKKTGFGNAENDHDDEPEELELFINSKTTGKFRRVMENGRSHIVTQMVPIVGDSVMNDILYPDDVVSNSMSQFEMLPAPAGHPKVRGIKTSIRNPLAVNAHYIGGFTRKPKKIGRRVIAEFWLDEEVAAASERGRAVLAGITNGERIGVSTDGIAKVHVANGLNPVDQKNFNLVADKLTYDHTAILLDELAAGAHVGTELITNADGSTAEITICNVDAAQMLLPDQKPEAPKTYHEMFEAFSIAVKNAFSESQLSLNLRDILLEEKALIVSAWNRETEKSSLYKVPYSIDEANNIMIGDDIKKIKEKIVYEEVTNNQGETGADDMELNIENATKHLEDAGRKVLDGEQIRAFENYEAKKDAFENWQKAEAKRLQIKRDAVIENTAMDKADVEGMSETALDKMLDLAKNKPFDNSLRGGGGGRQPGSEGGAVSAADLAGIANSKKEDK